MQADARSMARGFSRLAILPSVGIPSRTITETRKSVPSANARNLGKMQLPSNLSSSIPVRSLTAVEMHEKRNRGLCFNCDERWSMKHRCKNKGLVMLLDGDDIDTPDEEAIADGETTSPDNVIMEDVSSLNTLLGAEVPRSLRILGKHGKFSFQVLIDNGSTQNFIKPALVERLCLTITPTSGFRVYIRNGNSLVCEHKCVATVDLQGSSFSIDFYVLHIQGPDMILGIQWLRDLGRVTHDYGNSRMEFQ